MACIADEDASTATGYAVHIVLCSSCLQALAELYAVGKYDFDAVGRD